MSTEFSVSKTLAAMTGFGYFVAGRRTILGKFIGSIFYKDVNSAMVAAYRDWKIRFRIWMEKNLLLDRFNPEQIK